MEKKNELQVFNNEQFGEVRVFIKDDDYWFLAKDIATILEYRTSNDMTRILDDDEKDTQIVRTLGGEQEMVVINESGLYSAILKSRKPEAKQFKKWVTSEVLPTIRKHGAYMSEEVIEKTLTDPDFIIQLATQLKEEKQKRLLAEKQIEEQKPLVTFAETCLKSNDNILMRELSKVANDEGINIGQNRLYDKLREWKLIMSKPSTEPYQYGMDRNWFVVEEKNINTPYGVKLTRTTKVTPKGQVYIIEKLKKEGF